MFFIYCFNLNKTKIMSISILSIFCILDCHWSLKCTFLQSFILDWCICDKFELMCCADSSVFLTTHTYVLGTLLGELLGILLGMLLGVLNSCFIIKSLVWLSTFLFWWYLFQIICSEFVIPTCSLIVTLWPSYMVSLSVLSDDVIFVIFNFEAIWSCEFTSVRSVVQGSDTIWC